VNPQRRIFIFIPLNRIFRNLLFLKNFGQFCGFLTALQYLADLKEVKFQQGTKVSQIGLAGSPGHLPWHLPVPAATNDFGVRIEPSPFRRSISANTLRGFGAPTGERSAAKPACWLCRLSKGSGHPPHLSSVPKSHLCFNRLGELRDRSFEAQRHRASGLNLVVAAIILWNAVYLERAIGALRQRGRQVDDGFGPRSGGNMCGKRAVRLPMMAFFSRERVTF